MNSVDPFIHLLTEVLIILVKLVDSTIINFYLGDQKGLQTIRVVLLLSTLGLMGNCSTRLQCGFN